MTSLRDGLAPRQRLQEYATVDAAVSLIQSSNHIVVVSGAGISVSAGIPDFRSKNGVYELVEKKFDLPDPQSLFDINFFVDDPTPFFTFAKNLFPGTYQPTASHRFIKGVEDRGKLLRNYTQNIDTLESVVGISRKVTCHGSFETATCLACKHTVPCEDIREAILSASVPRCTQCDHDLNILKPDIVFFGEPLGETFERHVQADLPLCDLLIVMGSSMRVQPVSSIPSMLAREVPQILINREQVMSPHEFDVALLGPCIAVASRAASGTRVLIAEALVCVARAGDCDVIVNELCRRLDWNVGTAAAASPAAPGDEREGAHPRFIAPNRFLFHGGVDPTQSPLADSGDDDADEDEDEDDGGEENAGEEGNSEEDGEGKGEAVLAGHAQLPAAPRPLGEGQKAMPAGGDGVPRCWLGEASVPSSSVPAEDGTQCAQAPGTAAEPNALPADDGHRVATDEWLVEEARQPSMWAAAPSPDGHPPPASVARWSAANLAADING